jgi:hypothetical protein
MLELYSVCILDFNLGFLHFDYTSLNRSYFAISLEHMFRFYEEYFYAMIMQNENTNTWVGEYVIP